MNKPLRRTGSWAGPLVRCHDLLCVESLMFCDETQYGAFVNFATTSGIF